jgi:hypothetical protein
MTVSLTPRLLSAREAAAYFQLPVRRFERLHIGRVCFGAKVLYDRVALDSYLDGVSGLDLRQEAHHPHEPEAALARSPSGRPPRP